MRRARRFGLAAAVVLALAAFACNALNGAGNFTVGPPCEGCADSDGPGDDGNSAADGLAALEAAADGGGADAMVDVMVGRPSFCDGIAMYARFDNTLTTSQGTNPETPPTTSFLPGRFGSAASLTGAAGALFYVVGDGGVPFSKDEGTIAMWIKPQWPWPPGVTRIFWKPVSDRTATASNESGPYMIAQAPPTGFFGTVNTEPGGATRTTAGGTAMETAPYWSSQWNHLAETWSRTSPTLSFTLNGAEGDASITRHETDAGWAAQAPTVAYVRLSSNSFPSDSAYDDVVLWNRPLSLAEIQAVYGAGIAVGDLCGL